MKLKDKLLKVLLVFVLAGVAINLSTSAMNEAVIHPAIEKNTFTCFPSQSYNPPNVANSILAGNSSPFNNTKSELLAYLFQLMFILFFISPPLIVIMLFLIWKELKARNKMK